VSLTSSFRTTPIIVKRETTNERGLNIFHVSRLTLHERGSAH